MLVQLRYRARSTSETYVSERGWEEATLEACPAHPEGGCGFARLGTYARKWPAGARIARWYCPQAHQTFSLLPDFFAARIPGPLADLERVALLVDEGQTAEAVAEQLRPDIELPGAVRWVRRRLRWVREALVVARGLLGELAGVAPRLSTVGAALNAVVGTVLVRLRAELDSWLGKVAAPTGLCPRWSVREVTIFDFNNRRGRRTRDGPP